MHNPILEILIDITCRLLTQPTIKSTISVIILWTVVISLVVRFEKHHT